MSPRPTTGLTCPSAQPDMAGARIIGVLAGTPEAPEIAYLAPDAQVDASVLHHLGPLEPTEVFRFAASCEEHRCSHFAAGRCSLARRIVEQLPEVVELLPRCQIRATCRWFAEEGSAACRRCPQVVTRIPKADDALNRAALPPEMSPPPATRSLDAPHT
jgi:hypothetical protein